MGQEMNDFHLSHEVFIDIITTTRVTVKAYTI